VTRRGAFTTEGQRNIKILLDKDEPYRPEVKSIENDKVPKSERMDGKKMFQKTHDKIFASAVDATMDKC
jgi:hypothetical protein